MDVYYGRPDGFYQRYAPTNDAGPWTAASDEANDYSQPSIVALANAMNLSSWGTTSGTTYWTDWYKCIRTATDFINHIDGTTAVDVTDFLKVHFKAEARGLRAIFYFWLLRLYGPIPILHDEIDVNASGSSVYIPRTPFDTCVSYIVSQLDSAYDEIQSVSNADHLGSTPISLGTNPEYGRITTGICKAYKEQVLMLAASPLFNGNTDYAALKNNDGTQLISQTSDINKWKLAADAAKAFIDEFVPGTYSIYTSTGSDSFTNAYNSCRNVVITDWNSEWIWGRSYLSSVSIMYMILLHH
ncbi:MAG: RagB/SusD family nutrient uptake outer membrane protein [Arachidicoccus sp.]|nr:RagB/SusD family nutrient uptake outer membrane protein [Arachidicoccus sp.]